MIVQSATMEIRQVSVDMFIRRLKNYFSWEIEQNLKYIEVDQDRYQIFLTPLFTKIEYLSNSSYCVIPVVGVREADAITTFSTRKPYYILPASSLQNLIVFQIEEQTRSDIRVVVTCTDSIVSPLFDHVMGRMGEFYRKNLTIVDESSANQDSAEKPRGRKLPEGDEILRLALAQMAIELKKSDSDLEYKQIIQLIDWPGWRDNLLSKLTQLRDYRDKLKRLEKNDPDGLLARVAEKRASLTEEKQKKRILA